MRIVVLGFGIFLGTIGRGEVLAGPMGTERATFLPWDAPEPVRFPTGRPEWRGRLSQIRLSNGVRRAFAHASRNGVGFDLCPLNGELIAAAGGLYRAQLSESGSDDRLDLYLIPPDKVPPGLAVTPRSICLPLHPEHLVRGTGFPDTWAYVGNSVGVFVTRDPAGADGKLGDPVATVYEADLYDNQKPNGWNSPFWTSRVRKGDVLVLRGAGRKVLNVVPHDAKAGVLGWIELAEEWALPKDLKAKGVAYVEPEHTPSKPPAAPAK